MLSVTFTIGRQHYGLPVEHVTEIVLRPALVELAGAPPFLRGLLNLRGSYLPVLDLNVLLGEQPQEDLNSHVIIAGRESPELGLLVEQVRDVRAYEPEQVTPLNQGTAAAFLTGVINDKPGSIVLLDLQELLMLTPALQPEVMAR
jgi:purine-binding chemotaxis protein CheW